MKNVISSCGFTKFNRLLLGLILFFAPLLVQVEAYAIINSDKVVWIKQNALITYGGSTQQLQLKLSSAPTSDVTFYANLDTGTYSESPMINVSNGSHTFTTVNWNTPWVISVNAGANSGPSINNSYTFDVTVNGSYDDSSGYYPDPYILPAKVYLPAEDNATVPMAPLGGVLSEGTPATTISGNFSYSPSCSSPVPAINILHSSLQPPEQVTLSSNFPGPSSPLAIPVNFGTQNVNTTMSVIDDDLVEGTHIAKGNYSYSTCISGTPITEIGTNFLITDNDTGVVSVSALDDTATEGAAPVDPGTYRIAIDKANYTGEDLVINYTMSGSAANGTDYTTLSGSVTMPSSANSKYVDVALTPANDGTSESTELATLTIDSLSGPAASLFSIDSGNKTADVSIIDGVSNFPPTDLNIDGNYTDSIAENTASGTDVGTLTSVDPDSSDTHTYSLVSGSGSDDNARFTISGDKLKLNFVPDYETPLDNGDTAGNNTYSVRVRTTDSSNNTYENILIISISNVSEAGFKLIQSATTSIKTSSTISENGGTDTFRVVLNEAPSSNVNFTISSSSVSDATISPSSLTFTTANWNVPQTVTITGVDDQIDRNDTAIVSVAVNDSLSDNNFDPLSDQTIAVTLTDNDVAGVNLTPTSGSVTEGSSTTYNLVLNTQPTSNVAITPNTSSGATSSPATITFTNSNWNIPQAITLNTVDDTLANGTRIITTSHSYSSSDLNYNGLSISDHSLTISDNDIAGVTISNLTSAVTEGSHSNYSVKLNTQPSADVSVSVTTDNSNSTANVSSLTFNSTNWNVPQTVTLNTADNSLIDGIRSTVFSHTTSSGDTNYNSIVVSSHNLTINDNDSASVLVSPLTLSVSEGGLGGSYSVRIGSQPASGKTVIVNVSSDSQSTTSLSSLTFNNSNWNIAQTVTVTAVDDSVIEGNHQSTISHSINSLSTDPNYPTAMSLSTLTANISDNDDDGDGVTLEQENSATSDGDGNGDGILDSIQPQVTSVINPLTQKNTTLVADSVCSTITSMGVIDESSLLSKDNNFSYPVGLNNFSLTCSSQGSSATVKFYYDKVYDTSAWKFRKLNPFTAVFYDITNIVSFGTAIVNGRTVTTASYIVTDGDPITDADGIVNGVIVDPAGPAIEQPNTATGNNLLSNTGQSIVAQVISSIVMIAAALSLRRDKRQKQRS